MDYSVLKDYYSKGASKTEAIRKKSIEFLNSFCGLKTHTFNDLEIQAFGHFEFSLKMDALLWRILNPKSQKDISYFYKITPFECMKNLRKSSDYMHFHLMKILVSMCQKAKAKTILDFGGGSGFSSLVLSNVGFDVTYAEVNILSLKWMRYVTKELNYKIKIIDLNKTRIKKKYDLILVKDVFEHFKNPKQKIDELRKLCKVFYITPGTCQGKEDWLPMHYEFDIEKVGKKS